jgi:hypothetical protein
MDSIKVIWKSYHEPEIIARGYWDQGILEESFNRKGPYTWHHQTEFENIAENEGGVVVINGRTHAEDTDLINADLSKLRWVVLVITGDEEALFPFESIRHPLLRVWVQLPRMNRHNDVNYKLPNGPRPCTREVLSRIGPQSRTLDWFFAGQINHDRREQCAHELRLFKERNIHPNGVLVETAGFGKETLSQTDYVKHLAQAKIVLCPSGIETPDTFRLYEALEAGCLPVVDAFATRQQSPGFWKYLFGEDVPFPIVDYWDKLPQLMPELLRDWPQNANKAAAWWQNKKRELYFKLIGDVKEVSK